MHKVTPIRQQEEIKSVIKSEERKAVKNTQAAMDEVLHFIEEARNHAKTYNRTMALISVLSLLLAVTSVALVILQTLYMQQLG